MRTILKHLKWFDANKNEGLIISFHKPCMNETGSKGTQATAVRGYIVNHLPINTTTAVLLKPEVLKGSSSEEEVLDEISSIFSPRMRRGKGFIPLLCLSEDETRNSLEFRPFSLPF